MAISPTSASRCCKKDDVGVDVEAEGLNGVRGGGWLVNDIAVEQLGTVAAALYADFDYVPILSK